MAAIELGAIYRVYNPSASEYFTLNDSTDPYFVGRVDDIVGLDAPGIRENAQVKSAGMGGYHGSFWADRRPWSISGFVMPVFPINARSASQELMESVLIQCLQKDGILTWLPSDGNQRQLNFRYQQPFRSTKGQSNVNRNFQIAGVTADWRIVAPSAHDSPQIYGPFTSGAYSGYPTSSVTHATNIGNVDAAPIFTIWGPIANPLVWAPNIGMIFDIGVVVNSGAYLVVDLTQTYPTVYTSANAEVSGLVGTDSNWDIAVPPGGTDFYLAEGAIPTTTTATTSFKVTCRDSWA